MYNYQPSVTHPGFNPLFLSSPGTDPTSYLAKMSSVNSEFALARMMATLTQHKQHFFNAFYRDRDRDRDETNPSSSSLMPDNFQRQIMNNGKFQMMMNRGQFHQYFMSSFFTSADPQKRKKARWLPLLGSAYVLKSAHKMLAKWTPGVNLSSKKSLAHSVWWKICRSISPNCVSV